jgi:hypothetical protein
VYLPGAESTVDDEYITISAVWTVTTASTVASLNDELQSFAPHGVNRSGRLYIPNNLLRLMGSIALKPPFSGTEGTIQHSAYAGLHYHS